MSGSTGRTAYTAAAVTRPSKQKTGSFVQFMIMKNQAHVPT